MTDQIDERAKRLRDMVVIILDAVSRADADQMGGTAIDAQMVINAFHYITASMIEARPEITTASSMRIASETQAKIMLGFMKELRVQFERTGIHAWDVMNVPAEKMQ